MPSKTDIWMPLYIGDYLSATTHLSAEESGAYLHLLMHQWKNGTLPAESEALRRIARVDRDAWSNAWTMLGPFFDDAKGYPVQLRLEAIRADADAKKEKAVAKATAAATAKWANHAPSNAPRTAPSNARGMLGTCPSSSSTDKEQIHGFEPSMVGSGVLQELSLSGQDLLRNLTEVAKAEIGKGADGQELMRRMVAAWNEYEREKPNLKYTKGAAKFFGEGDWKDSRGWPWKDGKSAPKAKVEESSVLAEIRARQAEAHAEKARQIRERS